MFSTKTNFVFTLTGQNIPDELTIQILNISGRLIKQLKLSESENIKEVESIKAQFSSQIEELTAIVIHPVSNRLNSL